MLARVAESLYWIGRNVERCEHCCRYMKVQFFSTLEAPMSQNKDFNLRSILFMSGGNFQSQTVLSEGQVWQKVIFDANNSDSLLSLVKNTRENARSIRNNISEEFWESINKWYLYTQKLDAEKFSSDKLFEFSEDMNLQIVLIKSRLHHTFLHDEIWSFVCLGIYIERALQILRIVRSKISDSIILSDNGVNQALLQYQWTTLLMSLEAFGVHKKKYKGLRSRQSILELVLANSDFPRSLSYVSLKIKRHLEGLSVSSPNYQHLKNDFYAILDDCLAFNDFSNEGEVINFIDNAYNCYAKLHYDIEALYFQ